MSCGDHSRVMDTSVLTSPAVDTSFTTPTPLQYHLFSLPDSSSDQSFVFKQSVKVPAGTVTDSPIATIWPMSSATPRPYEDSRLSPVDPRLPRALSAHLATRAGLLRVFAEVPDRSVLILREPVIG